MCKLTDEEIRRLADDTRWAAQDEPLIEETIRNALRLQRERIAGEILKMADRFSRYDDTCATALDLEEFAGKLKDS